MNHTISELGNQPDIQGHSIQVPGAGDIHISPFYHSSINEITQPNSYTACSHYLTRRWKRELGPTGYAILTSFRDRCFFNRKTGELRDMIQVPVTEIAEECGISEKTVRRELASNKALQRFVRAQREPVPDPRRGGWRWGTSTFQVAMDDPLHPNDEQELLEIVGRKAVEAEKGPEDALARARRLAASSQPASRLSTLGQFVRAQKDQENQRSDKLTESPVNLSGGPDKLTTTSGQIDRTLKSLDSSLLKNTFLDAALPGDSTSSLSPEQIVPFAQITESEQAPWLEQAETELRENFGLAAWLKTAEKAKAGIRAQRAGNLYQAQKKAPSVS